MTKFHKNWWSKTHSNLPLPGLFPIEILIILSSPLPPENQRAFSELTLVRMPAIIE